jgi:hypothetical protein
MIDVLTSKAAKPLGLPEVVGSNQASASSVMPVQPGNMGKVTECTSHMGNTFGPKGIHTQ